MNVGEGDNLNQIEDEVGLRGSFIEYIHDSHTGDLVPCPAPMFSGTENLGQLEH